MSEPHILIARIEADLAALRQLLAADDLPVRQYAPPHEAWLAPCQLSERLGLGQPYIRKLIWRGLNQELPGFKREGGRLFATAEAVKEIRDSQAR